MGNPFYGCSFHMGDKNLHYLTKTNWITEIEQRKENGLLREHSIDSKQLLHHLRLCSERLMSIDLRQAQLSASTVHLALEVTEACNLRCKYCVYSGKYPDERVHSSRSMLPETVDKSYDFIRGTYKNLKELHVSFYGGEPLLNMPAIKHAVSEGIDRFHEIGISFGIATNGIAIEQRIAQYLKQHKFEVQISLDGPCDIHDANRIDGRDRGTFERVMESLRLLEEIGVRPVTISCTVASTADLVQTADFFNTSPVFMGKDIHLGRVAPHQEACETAVSLPNETALHRGLIDYLCTCATLDKPFYKALFYAQYRSIHMRKDIDIYEDNVFRDSLCPIGIERLLVGVDGAIYPCEQSARKSYKIGDIAKGLDFSICREINRRYLSFRERYCSECWAIRLCGACQPNLMDGHHYNIDSRASKCDRIRKSLKEKLAEYTEVLIGNPSVLDELKKRW